MVTTIKKNGSTTVAQSPQRLLKAWQDNLYAFLKQRFDRSTLRRAILDPLWRAKALAVITRLDLTQHPDLYQLRWFGRSHDAIAQPPITLEPPADVIASKVGAFALQQPFVAELQNIQLIGPSALAVTGDRAIVMESVLPNRDNGEPGLEGIPLRTLLRRELTRFDAPRMDTVCSLVTPWCKIYAHWLCESLTRLEGAEYYEQQTGRKPTLLIHQNPSKWQIESLQLLGYSLDDFVQWNGSRVQVDRLVLPSFRRQARWSDPDAYQWMRDRMIANLPAHSDLPLSPRILISRANAAGRRMLNEEAVMEFLAPLGFRSYVTESLSFADEVRLFSQAEVVIGTHGSGFTNIIFSKCKPLVIDLYSSWFSGSFFQLTASMGGRYACLPCEPKGANAGLKNSDMWVDISRLAALLKVALPSG